MGVWEWMRGVGNAVLGRTYAYPISLRKEPDNYQYYDSLDIRYENQDYERLADLLKETGDIPPGFEAIKSMRNPVNRQVEVYAANLLTEDLLEHLALPEGSEARVGPLRGLIRQVWAWSEWKEEARRAFPTHGELWLRAASSDDGLRVYPQILDPRHVTDFDENERGYLTYLRLDIPQERRDGDDTEDFLYVEVWDKEKGTYDVYHGEDAEPGDKIEDLGPPVKSMVLGRKPNGGGERFTGYDFIPVVHVRFKRVLGKKRGVTPYAHALNNVDRLNELVTKLHDMLFPDVVVVITREGMGGDGEPLPPIQLEGLEAQTALTEAERVGFMVVEVTGQKMIRLPSGAKLDYKIPPIDFGSHLAVIEGEEREVERLCVELAYYRLRELELSGYAIELTLRDLVDRIKAARQNLERGLVRFNQMAITIGQVLGIEGFSSVGTFEEGALDHAFADRDVFVPPERDRAQTDTFKAQALGAYAALGMLKEALLAQGFSEEDATRIAAAAPVANTPALPSGATPNPQL